MVWVSGFCGFGLLGMLDLGLSVGFFVGFGLGCVNDVCWGVHLFCF